MQHIRYSMRRFDFLFHLPPSYLALLSWHESCDAHEGWRLVTWLAIRKTWTRHSSRTVIQLKFLELDVDVWYANEVQDKAAAARTQITLQADRACTDLRQVCNIQLTGILNLAQDVSFHSQLMLFDVKLLILLDFNNNMLGPGQQTAQAVAPLQYVGTCCHAFWSVERCSDKVTGKGGICRKCETPFPHHSPALYHKGLQSTSLNCFAVLGAPPC